MLTIGTQRNALSNLVYGFLGVGVLPPTVEARIPISYSPSGHPSTAAEIAASSGIICPSAQAAWNAASPCSRAITPGQQVVTPVDQRPQRLVARQGRATAARQQPKAI